MEVRVEAFIRGYMIQYTGRFISEDPVLSKRMSADVMEQIKRNETAVEMKDWRPRAEVTALWEAIVDASEPSNQEAAYQSLVRCGERMGSYATGTFLKLLLRVLTPKMFANKFPDFYKRDHRGGEGVVEEISPKRVVLCARGVKGYDHFGPITVGWCAVPLMAMGLKGIKMACTPWSLADPGPDEVRLIATWD